MPNLGRLTYCTCVCTCLSSNLKNLFFQIKTRVSSLLFKKPMFRYNKTKTKKEWLKWWKGRQHYIRFFHQGKSKSKLHITRQNRSLNIFCYTKFYTKSIVSFPSLSILQLCIKFPVSWFLFFLYLLLPTFPFLSLWSFLGGRGGGGGVSQGVPAVLSSQGCATKTEKSAARKRKWVTRA